MKPVVICLLFAFSPLWGAQESRTLTRYYHYDGKPIFLLEASFRRYVLPQLRGMSRDWERLLIKLEPLHEELVSLRKQGDELSGAWEKSKLACRSHFSQECDESYQKVHAVGRKIDVAGLIFWEKQTGLHPPGEGSGPMMELSMNLGKVLRSNYLVLHYLEEGLFFSSTHWNRHGKLVGRIDPLLVDLRFYSNAAITGFLPKAEKEMFDFVRDNFFSPLNIYVVKKKDREYLLRHLEELNISWHTFHMKLTKGFKKYPKSVKVYFTTMNKRWNSILKIILRTRGG